MIDNAPIAGGLPPIVIVLIGPSGVGKDSVIDRLVEDGVALVRPATMTTRDPRPGEVEGTHHYFVSREEFEREFAADELLERNAFQGNLYGVPRRSVRGALATGKHVVLRVDVNGAESLRGPLPDALFLSLEPESIEVLRRNLQRRGTETAEQIESRLATARDEMTRAREFCVVVVNVEGDLAATVAAVRTLIEHERARPGRVAVRI